MLLGTKVRGFGGLKKKKKKKKSYNAFIPLGQTVSSHEEVGGERKLIALHCHLQRMVSALRQSAMCEPFINVSLLIVQGKVARKMSTDRSF